jgi:hypothetical protein
VEKGRLQLEEKPPLLVQILGFIFLSNLGHDLDEHVKYQETSEENLAEYAGSVVAVGFQGGLVFWGVRGWKYGAESNGITDIRPNTVLNITGA